MKTKCDGLRHYTPTGEREAVLSACDCKKQVSDTMSDAEILRANIAAVDGPRMNTSTPLSIDGIRDVSYGTVCTLSQGERTIAASVLVADAAFIVRAVNSHAELLAVVKSMRLYIDTFSDESKQNFRCGGNGEYVDGLIAKAEQV